MNVSLSKDFDSEECCSCGVIFFITSSLKANLKKTKDTFYCPNGHAQSYRKSTADILQEQLDEKKKEIASLTSEIWDLKHPPVPKKKRVAKKK